MLDHSIRSHAIDFSVLNWSVVSLLGIVGVSAGVMAAPAAGTSISAEYRFHYG